VIIVSELPIPKYQLTVDGNFYVTLMVGATSSVLTCHFSSDASYVAVTSWDNKVSIHSECQWKQYIIILLNFN